MLEKAVSCRTTQSQYHWVVLAIEIVFNEYAFRKTSVYSATSMFMQIAIIRMKYHFWQGGILESAKSNGVIEAWPNNIVRMK